MSGACQKVVKTKRLGAVARKPGVNRASWRARNCDEWCRRCAVGPIATSPRRNRVWRVQRCLFCAAGLLALLTTPPSDCRLTGSDPVAPTRKEATTFPSLQVLFGLHQLQNQPNLICRIASSTPPCTSDTSVQLRRSSVPDLVLLPESSSGVPRWQPFAGGS